VSQPKAELIKMTFSDYDQLHLFNITLAAMLWHCSENNCANLEELQDSKVQPYVLKLEAGIENGLLEMDEHHQELLKKDGIIRLTRFNLVQFFHRFQHEPPTFLMSPMLPLILYYS